MSKMTSLRVIALALSMLMIIGTVKGRWLDLETYSTSMISYGVHNISNENPPNLELRFSNSSTSYGGKRCESLYRFLPCANTMREGVLLMFLYAYLMISGEGWINKGGKVLYLWMGANDKVGESVFRVLMALPKIIVIVVPGILSSVSDAHDQVVFGVNMYAGSTVITLTLVWGMSIIFIEHKVKKEALQESDQQQESNEQDSSRKCLSQNKVKKEASQESDPQQDSSRKCLSLLTDTSVNIDKDTAKIAVNMLLSLIPFAFAGLVSFVNTPAMSLIALIVSGMSLLVYFGYQVYYPWIGVRSLTYLQQEYLTMRFLDYVKMLAQHVDLVDMDGKPDSTCLKSIFNIVDKNEDKSLTHDELETVMEKIFQLQYGKISKEYAKTEILISFDKNEDGVIGWEEFEQVCTNWLKNLNSEANNPGSAYKVICDEMLQTLKTKQDSKLSITAIIICTKKITAIIMPCILKQVLEKKELVTKDGEPNREMIEGLFSNIHKDNDNAINKDELKQFIKTLDIGIKLDHDRVLHALVKDFDEDNDNVVEKKEFVEGFIRWIEEAINHDQSIKDIAEAIKQILEVRQKPIIKQRSKLSIFDKILPSVQKKALEKNELVTKDGQPNREKIEGLFSNIDKDNNNEINKDELKQFIETLDFGIELDRDRVSDELVKEFVDDNINVVKKKEFVDGLIKWIKEVIDITEDIWGEVTLKTWEKLKAIVYVISGVAIMITITSAFITSVKQFSSAARIPFLFTSFVLAPIAMKAKMVIKAFLKPRVRTNASLTFSEIYNELVMNNLLGLFSLLVTLYIKGLSWTYSAQVFTIMIPCAIVGIFTFRRYNYPLWASIPAILLYPLSVYIYFLLANA